MYISTIAELHLCFCSCCSCGFLLCLCSFSLVFGKPNAIDHPQVMTMFTGINPKWWAYYWPHITQFPSFQSESKHTVQVETWELCQTLPLLLPASWQPLPWNKSSVLLRLKQSEKWWCLPCACNCSSWVSYQIFSRGSRQSQSKRPSCIFLQTTSERPKRQRLLWLPRSSSTTVLRKSVTICWNCQGLQSSEAKNAILYHNRWPQKNSAEVMKDRQSINLILRTLLDPRLLLLDCDCELLPSCTKISPQTSLPKISVHSASRKSHRARSSTNFNYSSTLRLKIVKQKKVNHWESHKHDRNIMPSWLDSAPKWNKKENWKNKNKKEKEKKTKEEERTDWTKKEINGIQNWV